MKAKSIHPLLFVPGMLFWALVIGGAVTRNSVMIGAAVVLAVITVVSLVTVKVRAASAEKAEKRRLWSTGKPAKARVVSIGTRGGGMNDDPRVALELEVAVDGAPPYRVTVEQLISRLAIPRIQPECQIVVRVDPADAKKVLVDSALTPHGYD